MLTDSTNPASYLNGRKQKVKINFNFSTWIEIISGVPQGPVLGPLLFNIFINDLFLFVVNSDVCNFSDDNTLSIANISIEEIITHLQNDIRILQTWYHNNGMLWNVTKCKCLIVESYKSKKNEAAKMKVHDQFIVENKEGKLLGITLDSNITMNKHIKNICQQASNKLNTLCTNS